MKSDYYNKTIMAAMLYDIGLLRNKFRTGFIDENRALLSGGHLDTDALKRILGGSGYEHYSAILRRVKGISLSLSG